MARCYYSGTGDKGKRTGMGLTQPGPEKEGGEKGRKGGWEKGDAEKWDCYRRMSKVQGFTVKG